MKELQKLKKLLGKVQLVLGMMVLVLTLALCVDGFAMVSNAETQAKVTASSAKVRKEASTSSESVGSATRDTVVTVVGETQGADGYVWYQVVVDANTSGYIRSDLLALTVVETEVEKLNPASGTVKGSSSVRVRAGATTNSAIVENVASGTALTITGRATAADGNVWYQVSFISNGTEVNGFIRSDYVDVAGELTPYTETPVTPPTEAPGTATPEPPATDTPVVEEPEPVKKYETVLRDNVWYVMDTDTNEGWDIVKLKETAETNAAAYAESEKKVKSQKVTIIFLIFLLIGAVAGIAFLIYKIKDMMDSAYFNEVEAETLRRKNAQATQSQKKVMHTVGEEKKSGASQGRPAGAPQGQRPQGARPAGAPQGARPAGASQGARPAGAPQGQRPAGAPQGQRPQGTPQAAQNQTSKNAGQGQSWQSKNFMADDDDEFEFEFLSYENDDEK